MLRPRVFRLSAGALVLGASVLILLPYATSHVSHSAVINAPVVAIKSPFDGQLASEPRRPGTAVQPGEVIVTLTNKRQNRTELGRLSGHLRALELEQDAIGVEIARLRALDADLAARMDRTTALARDVLRFEREALSRTAAAEAAELQRLQAEARRLGTLGASGTVSRTRIEDVQARVRIAAQRLEARRAEIGKLDRQLHAISEGALPSFGSEDGSYARQRRDEIAIRLADLERRKADLAAKRLRVTRELTALRAERRRLRSFAPRARGPVVVWTAGPAADSPVAAGDEVLQVLDCSRRFIEVTVSERAFEAIGPDAPMQVRLQGTGRWFTAQVETVRGAGSRMEHGRLAGRPEVTAEGLMTVMVRLDPPQSMDAATAARFCDVGRTAEVRFDRDLGGVVDRVAARLRALAETVVAHVDPPAPPRGAMTADAAPPATRP